MGNSSSTPIDPIDMKKVAARNKKIDATERKAERRRDGRWADTRTDTVDYKGDRGKAAWNMLGGWKINVARIAALVAVIAYMLPVLNGTPLSSEANARDGVHTFVSIRDSVAAEPKNSGNGVEWRFGVTGWCAQADAQIYGTPNVCVYKWFWSTDGSPQQLPSGITDGVAHTLSIMVFFEFLAAVMSVLVFVIVLVWPFVARMVTPIGVYVIGGLYSAFGLVATIGIPAVVVPAAQDSDLVFVGLGTYCTIIGYVFALIAVILWYMCSGKEQWEKDWDNLPENKKWDAA